MASTLRDQYALLVKKRREIACFSQIEHLLTWDQSVNMPPKASAQRGLQKAAVEGVTHDFKTSAELRDILTKLKENSYESSSELNEKEKAVVRDSQLDYDRESAITRDLATRIAKLTSDSFEAWVNARTKNDFSIFRPFLEEWIQALQEKAELIRKKNPEHAQSNYEILMDGFERGLTCKNLDAIFSEIKSALIPLIAAIKNKPKPDMSFLKHEFDTATQNKISTQIAKDMGYDFERGKLDVSVHPFTVTVGSTTDIRITTKYKPDDLTMGLGATIHESGHALYEQGLDPEFAGLPGGCAVTYGMHESQSLFWEKMVGQSEPFWKKYWPLVHSSFPQIPREATENDWFRAYNIVEPSMIRVEADELTYPLHIIIRYEIESALFNGDLKVTDDLPNLWNKKMQEYLGITPADTKEGILQDIHWSMGYFGYFPTYTLGAIWASQFYKKAKEQIPDMEKQIEEGQFSTIKKWLNENIHFRGGVDGTGNALCKQVTGEEINVQVYTRYLKEKYTKLYNL